MRRSRNTAASQRQTHTKTNPKQTRTHANEKPTRRKQTNKQTNKPTKPACGGLAMILQTETAGLSLSALKVPPARSLLGALALPQRRASSDCSYPLRRLFVPLTPIIRTPYSDCSCLYPRFIVRTPYSDCSYPLLRLFVPPYSDCSCPYPRFIVRTPYSDYSYPLTPIVPARIPDSLLVPPYSDYSYPLLRLLVPPYSPILRYCGTPAPCRASPSTL